MTLKVGEEEVEFNLFDAIKYPSFIDTAFWIDVIDELTRDVFRTETSNLSFETCLENAEKLHMLIWKLQKLHVCWRRLATQQRKDGLAIKS